MVPALFLAAAVGTIAAQVITTVVSFFIVLWILYKLAWDPVVRLLDERRKVIADEFDSIDRQQTDLSSRIRDYEERLRQIDNEARERLNKAMDEGRKAASEIVEEARVASEEMKNKARTDIQMEVEKARVQLRDEVIRLTIGATEKLLRTELDDARHRQLVNDFIADLQRREAS